MFQTTNQILSLRRISSYYFLHPSSPSNSQLLHLQHIGLPGRPLCGFALLSLLVVTFGEALMANRSKEGSSS